MQQVCNRLEGSNLLQKDSGKIGLCEVFLVCVTGVTGYFEIFLYRRQQDFFLLEALRIILILTCYTCYKKKKAFVKVDKMVVLGVTGYELLTCYKPVTNLLQVCKIKKGVRL